MKTIKFLLKITLGVFLMTTVAFANNNDPKNIERPSDLNKEYVKVVQENSSQMEAEFLSGLISEYDVRDFEKFDSRNDDFQVIYKSNKGYADVKYDYKGRIISVTKNLTNVMLPKKVVKNVSLRYNGYEIVKNNYKESYMIGEEFVKTYVLTLQKGKEKKRIRMKV